MFAPRYSRNVLNKLMFLNENKQKKKKGLSVFGGDSC